MLREVKFVDFRGAALEVWEYSSNPNLVLEVTEKRGEPRALFALSKRDHLRRFVEFLGGIPMIAPGVTREQFLAALCCQIFADDEGPAFPEDLYQAARAVVLRLPEGHAAFTDDLGDVEDLLREILGCQR